MVKLFAKGTTTFSGNGKAVLTPTVCTVSEVAGGGYELHMEHPFDPEGRYLLLEDEEIIVAPVPPFHRDAITLPEMTIYIVNTDATPVYSALPRTTTDESKVDQIRKVKAAPGDYAWAPGTNYNVGALVTYGGRIYRAKQYNFAVTPGTANQVWGYVTTVTGTYTGDVTTIPGTVVETLPLNAQVFFLADYSQKYIRVRTVPGNEGYIAREKVTVTQDKQSGQVIPAKDITEQAFRIYSVTCEEELGSVVVEARHISYDFAGNALYKCELKQADPATAISMLRGTLMEPDNRVIACDIVTDQKITQDWSFRNPVNALLGQDDGLVPLLDAKLLRDNRDFYILDNSSPRKGITLAYGRNLTGVQWNRNTENVITRLVPRCNLSNGGFLYVDGIFVDSERISDYPVHRIEVMDCGYTIGQKYTPPEGGEDVVWTEDTAKAQMLKDARERFTKQHVDSVAVSLTVEFLLLGDTEEFRQYRGLQRVNIYDEITVITGPSGMKSTAQVTEYEYDCILQRYNSIRVGRVNTFRRVPGFTLTSGSVTYSKLSPELVSLISGGTSTTGSSDDDSQADQPNGGAVLPPMTPVIDDLTHTDTDKALSANMGRELDRGKKDKQEPVTDPTASGSGVQFISGISQDKQGVITPVKKTVRTMGGASSSADGSSGLVPKPEAGDQNKFLRGDGTWNASSVQTDSAIVDGTTSQNPPTSEAVATYVEGVCTRPFFTTFGFSIPASGWTGSSSPYSYTVTNSKIGPNVTIDVYPDYDSCYAAFANVEWKRAMNNAHEDFWWEQLSNGVRFWCRRKPSGTIVGIVRVLGNAANNRMYVVASDEVTIAQGGTGASDAVGARVNLGLGRVENKNSEDIRNEITSQNVTNALGFTPKQIQTPVSNPTASGTAVSFVESISQNANGDIAVTRKTVPDASTSEKGVAQLDDTEGSTSTAKAATPRLVNTKAPKDSPVFTSSISMGRKSGTTVGGNSTTLGTGAEASGPAAFATGYETVASGMYSHAEGWGTVASGMNSHAEGWYTIANHNSQHVFGFWNVPDPSTLDEIQYGTYIEIVGNGGSTHSRSDARTLDQLGNERLMGDLYVGCNYDSSGGTKVLKHGATWGELAGRA